MRKIGTSNAGELGPDPTRSGTLEPDLPMDAAGQPNALEGARIIVVEDEVILALDITLTLEDAGAKIVGPFYRLSAALACEDTTAVDAAVLDVDLDGAEVFPLAERLDEAGVPFVFHTARTFDAREFPRAAICPKPCTSDRLVNALCRVIADKSDQKTRLRRRTLTHRRRRRCSVDADRRQVVLPGQQKGQLPVPDEG